MKFRSFCGIVCQCFLSTAVRIATKRIAFSLSRTHSQISTHRYVTVSFSLSLSLAKFNERTRNCTSSVSVDESEPRGEPNPSAASVVAIYHVRFSNASFKSGLNNQYPDLLFLYFTPSIWFFFPVNVTYLPRPVYHRDMQMSGGIHLADFCTTLHALWWQTVNIFASSSFLLHGTWQSIGLVLQKGRRKRKESCFNDTWRREDRYRMLFFVGSRRFLSSLPGHCRPLMLFLWF